MKQGQTIMDALEKYATPENEGKDIHLGHVFRNNLSQDELTELKSWNQLGETLYEKTEHGVTFTIDVYLE